MKLESMREALLKGHGPAVDLAMDVLKAAQLVWNDDAMAAQQRRPMTTDEERRYMIARQAMQSPIVELKRSFSRLVAAKEAE